MIVLSRVLQGFFVTNFLLAEITKWRVVVIRASDLQPRGRSFESRPRFAYLPITVPASRQVGSDGKFIILAAWTGVLLHDVIATWKPMESVTATVGRRQHSYLLPSSTRVMSTSCSPLSSSPPRRVSRILFISFNYPHYNNTMKQ